MNKEHEFEDASPNQRETFSGDGRRVIRHDAGDLPQILDQLGMALAETENNLFRQSGRLIRIYPVDDTKQSVIKRAKGSITLHPVDGAHLTELATRAATHERYDGRIGDYKICNCPRAVSEAYLSRGHWPELQELSGFVESPTISIDGRLIDQPGYDAETGIFAAFGDIPRYKSPSKKPSLKQAKESAQLLLDLVADFPFVADEDHSAFVAGILTALLRRSLPAAPMFAVTAPTPGTGKTLIAETFAIIATGRRASVISLGHDEAEFEKRLGGVGLAGDSTIVIDNIERPLKGDLLCQMATQEFVKLRPLGGSGMVSISTAVLLVATGNNLSIVGDLKRRVVLIRMDSKMERPEQRTFSNDHLETVFARRGELIRAALTIPLTYLANEAPAIKGVHPLGGFEHWDRLVRRPLIWLGLADPLKAAETLRDNDPDIETMRLLFSAWESKWGHEPVTSADLVSAAMQSMSLPGGGFEYSHPDLRDALQMVCSEKINARRLGYWLRAHKDRIIDGKQLVAAGTGGHDKVARWKVIGG